MIDGFVRREGIWTVETLQATLQSSTSRRMGSRRSTMASSWTLSQRTSTAPTLDPASTCWMDPTSTRCSSWRTGSSPSLPTCSSCLVASMVQCTLSRWMQMVGKHVQQLRAVRTMQEPSTAQDIVMLSAPMIWSSWKAGMSMNVMAVAVHPVHIQET